MEIEKQEILNMERGITEDPEPASKIRVMTRTLEGSEAFVRVMRSKAEAKHRRVSSSMR